MHEFIAPRRHLVRKSILIATLLAIGATTAGAACTDTLFLQSLTVYRQTLKNTATIGTWDSSLAINPWNLSELANAGPIGYSTDFGGKDTVTHVLRFQYNCGTDSITTVLSARIQDTLALVREDYVHKVRVDTIQQMQKVVMKGATNYTVNGAIVKFSNIWVADSFTIGARDSVRQAWQGLYHNIIYKGINISAGYLNRKIGQFKEDPIASYAALSTTIQSALSGGADSVVAELRMFKYVYDYTQPSTAILPRAFGAAAFSIRTLASGVEIALTRSAQVQIVGLDGRVVRSFAGASGSQLWDGRDNAGRKLSGIWLVRAEGLGAKTVLVR
jgi:hypothetical protein